jgi:hypothetical protein
MSLDGKIHIVAICKYDTFVTECISYISTIVTDQVNIRRYDRFRVQDQMQYLHNVTRQSLKKFKSNCIMHLDIFLGSCISL